MTAVFQDPKTVASVGLSIAVRRLCRRSYCHSVNFGEEWMDVTCNTLTVTTFDKSEDSDN
jgi:hypothetical protein